MNSMRPHLNLRILASARIARTNGFLTSIFAMALGAAVVAGSTPLRPQRRMTILQFQASPLPPFRSKRPQLSIRRSSSSHSSPKRVGDTRPFTRGRFALPFVTPKGRSAYTPLAADPDSETKSYYGTWTAYPYVQEFLVSFVANNVCQEVTPGSWYEGSVAPKYGIVTQAHVKGRLGNGECSDYVFTGAGIFYQWVHKTSSSRSDEFKANWKGGGMENKVTFDIKDKK